MFGTNFETKINDFLLIIILSTSCRIFRPSKLLKTHYINFDRFCYSYNECSHQGSFNDEKRNLSVHLKHRLSVCFSSLLFSSLLLLLILLLDWIIRRNQVNCDYSVTFYELFSLLKCTFNSVYFLLIFFFFWKTKKHYFIVIHRLILNSTF